MTFPVSRPPAPLLTPRLTLIALTDAMLDSEKTGRGHFSSLLGAEIPPEWPTEHWEPHVFDIILKQHQDYPATLGWHRYILLRRTRRLFQLRPPGPILIGALGAFPKPDDDAEIGYGLLPAFHRHGYATEATQALIAHLRAHSNLRSVTAQTLPTLSASLRVLEKCGLTPAGPGDEPPAQRFRLTF